MVVFWKWQSRHRVCLSVLALSSRFDGRASLYSTAGTKSILSVLALSSRFDGRAKPERVRRVLVPFSTRSVESF